MTQSFVPHAPSFDAADDDVFVFPASFAQQRLWFLDQFEPNSPFYNIPAAVRLTGTLDPAVLEQALNEIVARHETLRTTFAMQDGQPVQVIAPVGSQQAIALPIHDLSHLSAAEREAEALRLAQIEARTPFNLSAGPLLRFSLLRLAADEHIALVTMHHIISDGWSVGVFIHELAVLYSAFSQGQPSPLPELPIQYADYAEWQRERLQGAVLEAQIEYWKRQLSGELPVLTLPSDQPRPALQSSRGASLSMLLPRALLDDLYAFSRQENATLFMTLLAAFDVVLHRYSGQDDLCVGTPIANRTRAETEGLIGCFINTLVMRADLSGNPTFRTLLRQTRQTALDAYVHQDVPFEQLVEMLQPERDMSHTPLFQVMFILQNAGTTTQQLPGLRLEALDTDSGTATFDITFSLTEQADGLDVSVEYCTDLFERATIARMIGHFETLLHGIVEHADQPIAALPLLTESEREQLVIAWNRTDAPFPQDVCAPDLIAAWAARTPDAIAVSYENKRLTYAELDRRANQLARHLQALGVKPETLVGVCVERSLEMIVGVLGVLKAGGAYVPLDPQYPPDRLQFMLRDAAAPVLLTRTPDDPRRTEAAPWSLVDGPWSVIDLVQDWPAIAQQPTTPPDARPTPDDLAYVIYTSGSTGQSKGTLIAHRSLVNAYSAWEQAYDLPNVRAHLQMANFAFDVFTGDFVRALCSGATLVLCPRDFLLEPAKLYDLMRREQVECAEFVPAVLRLLVQQLDRSGQRLDWMKLLICGSDSWYAEEYAHFSRFVGAHTRVINSYGLTEATIDSTYFERGATDLTPGQPVPIGRPFANTKLYILDAQLQPVPVGVAGELCIGGVGVARGYLHRPELTAEKFVRDPFSPQPDARLYKTGDRARYRPDGNVELLGRIDDQVKLRGFRIELGEIEAVLGRHAAVGEAVVIVREAAPGDKRIAAYIVPTAAQFDATELRRYVQAHLPEYMTPAAFVQIEAVPLTPNGKVDRNALPVPDWSQVETAAYIAPRNAVEQTLADLWGAVLSLDQISVEANFFELGGHSLLATQVISRIREAFNIDLPLRTIFEAPTIAALAEQIVREQAQVSAEHAPPLLPVDRAAELPLSFAQQRLWFLDQLEPNSPFYNIPEALRLRGALDATLLERSLNEVVRRHEALRTVFVTIDGKPRQAIRPELIIALPLIDLHHAPAAEREAEALRLATADAQQPFDLARGPLLRAKLVRLAHDDHVVLLTLHHIVGDDWSTNVLISEIATIYAAYSAGQFSPLPELPIQYADYAAWQRQWLQGAVLEQQLAYWTEHLRGAPSLLELPTDRPRPPVQTYVGDYVRFTLPADLTQQVQALSRREGATLFMTLLAAFDVLLHRYSGQADISIGTPIAGRQRAETEGLIGFFINTLVLRARLDDAPTFRTLLGRVRETALGAYAHQDVPFEMLVDRVQPRRNLSHTPLFQVMFALQNAPLRLQALPGTSLTLEPVADAHSGTAKFDLTLFMVEDGNQLSGALEYNTDLFDAGTMERMIGHFEVLLRGIVAEPDQAVSHLPLLTAAERRQLLVEWNATAAPFPYDTCVHELFAAQAQRTPEALAVVADTIRLSYAELHARSNQLAHHLRALGVGPEVLVGVCMERRAELLIALLGVLKAGGAYVPLDPSYPAERLQFMLQDAQPRVLLTALPDDRPRTADNKQPEAFDPWSMARGPWSALDLVRDWPQIADAPTYDPDNRATPDNLAYVIYTSGSTGRPKGTLIVHRGLVNYLTWCERAYPVAAGQGAPVHSSIAFDLTITGLFAPLLSGRAVHLLPDTDDLEPLSAALQAAENFSLVKITPAHLDLLRHQLTPTAAANRTRSFIIGGENLLAESLHFWLQHAPDTQLVNEYGPTETVVGCCVYVAPPDLPRTGSVPIGRPIINTQVYVLDQHAQPVPVGVPGELYIGGAGVARGYLHRPDLTAEKFVHNPFVDAGQQDDVPPSVGGGRWSTLYRTGDLVRYRPDGNLEYLGRIDHQVKVRGFRIELGEIEAVLGRHAAVREVVVVARADESGHKRLVAYVAPHAEQPIIVADLREFLRSRLPEYMVPAAFVVLSALPLTGNGKVDRQALPEPDATRPELDRAFVAPRTPTETLLADIWAQVLSVAQVGIHDDFFELGGDSILSIQIIARANAAGLRLTPRDLFQASTVAGLAEVAHSADPGVTLAAAEAELPYWLSMAQRSLAPLPEDFRTKPAPNALIRQITVALSAAETHALLHDVPTAYRTETLEVVLTALVQAVTAWAGTDAVLLALGVDRLRPYPLRLELAGADDPGAALQAIKAQARQVPNAGQGYWLLREHAADPTAREQLHALEQPALGVRFRSDGHGTVYEHDHNLLHSCGFLLDCCTTDGELRLEWSYSAHLYEDVTAERLAHATLAALRTLISHCQAAETTTYSASDVAEFGWNEDDLGDILSAIGDLE